jgi:hypothetical protein
LSNFEKNNIFLNKIYQQPTTVYILLIDKKFKIVGRRIERRMGRFDENKSKMNTFSIGKVFPNVRNSEIFSKKERKKNGAH